MESTLSVWVVSSEGSLASMSTFATSGRTISGGDTEGIAPMTSVVEVALPRRADAVTDGGAAEDVLANAPKRDDGFFVVPKVLE